MGRGRISVDVKGAVLQWQASAAQGIASCTVPVSSAGVLARCHPPRPHRLQCHATAAIEAAMTVSRLHVLLVIVRLNVANRVVALLRQPVRHQHQVRCPGNCGIFALLYPRTCRLCRRASAHLHRLCALQRMHRMQVFRKMSAAPVVTGGPTCLCLALLNANCPWSRRGAPIF